MTDDTSLARPIRVPNKMSKVSPNPGVVDVHAKNVNQAYAERTMARAKYVDAFPFGYGVKGGYSPMTTAASYTAPPGACVQDFLFGQSALVQSAYRCSECSLMTKPRCLAILFWRFSISAS